MKAKLRSMVIEALSSRESVPMAELQTMAAELLGVRDVFEVRGVVWKLIDEDIADFTLIRDVKRGIAFPTATNQATPDSLALASSVKGMPPLSTLAILAAKHGDWFAKAEGETNRQWAARLVRASGNLV